MNQDFIHTRYGSVTDGCYEASRAAVLSGLPMSTIYGWARKGLVTPSVSSVKTKYWSYADLMVLRVVYWLRHSKMVESDIVAASPMGEVRKALQELERLSLDVWDENHRGQSPLRVDRSGRIHIVTDGGVQTPTRQIAIGEALDLLGPLIVESRRGPDLIRPRPRLRIIPGKVSGEPHIVDSRITTKSLAALFERYGDIRTVSALYPDKPPEAIAEAIEFERSLAA